MEAYYQPSGERGRPECGQVTLWTCVSLILGVPGSLLPACHPFILRLSSRSTSSTSIRLVNRNFLLVEARGVSPPLSEPLVDRAGVKMEGNGFLLVTGDVGALRGRPSWSGISLEAGHSCPREREPVI